MVCFSHIITIPVLANIVTSFEIQVWIHECLERNTVNFIFNSVTCECDMPIFPLFCLELLSLIAFAGSCHKEQ